MSEKKINWKESSILITGGTGSFGRKLVKILLSEYKPRRLAVFSRDELKQSELKKIFPEKTDSPIRYFLGDVRDVNRLKRAFNGVDIVIHAAALKQVPATEADPFEAVQTNIIGTKNVIESSIDAGVNRVICLSTDKAVNPINLYGATKLVAEKLTVQANAYSNNKRPIFACCRYGNVVGSRGSVVPIFKEQKFSGKLTVTDKRMTRFWITLEKGVRFVIHCLENMNGGELFIPKIPSTKITDIAEAIAPEAHISTIGIRPGEKLHETLISKDETRQVMEYDDFFVIEPSYHTWGFESHKNGKPISENFTYTSENSLFKLGVNEIKDLLDSDENK